MGPKEECTDRRMFCKRFAGVAVGGAFAGIKAIAALNPQQGDKASAETGRREITGGKEYLVSVCGTYCGACPMHINNQPGDERKRREMFKQYAPGLAKMKLETLVCDGCLSNGKLAAHCQKCQMRACAAAKEGVTRCSDCPEFACARITDFNNDGRLHHAELLDNLRNARKMGIVDWARHERERWQCPECRNAISWYDRKCSNCGAKRSERLFRLEQQ